MEEEIWMDIPEYEGLYMVSTHGRVKALDREITAILGYSFIKKGIIRKCVVEKKGYLCVKLSKDRIHKTFKVHRLVAIAFIPNPNNYPEVNHKNGIKSDNHIENLEWCTSSQNQKHAYKNGLKVSAMIGVCGKNNKSSKPIVQLDLDGCFLREFESIQEAKNFIGKQTVAINNCLNSKNSNSTSHGYKWVFTEEYFKII